MLASRIIPCLDVREGRVVKGVRFAGLRDMGAPERLSAYYEYVGADEIVLLDVSASLEGRRALRKTIKAVAEQTFLPLTVGGGIRSVMDAEALFKSGADKISLNTSAVENPSLIRKLADDFGSQSIVVAIDAKKTSQGWGVFTRSGSQKTKWTPTAWAAEAQRLGAGEILLTSIDSDGTKKGFDLDLLSAVRESTTRPLVASGGAGSLDDFVAALKTADAALAAGVFHSGMVRIPALKKYLKKRGVNVRL